MLLDSIISLGGLLSVRVLSSQAICDRISIWYTNFSSQSCRVTSYCFIWHIKILCGCGISCSALFYNGEWGYVCDNFIPHSSSSIFFHLLIFVYQVLYECIWYGTPASMKYPDKYVWSSLLCGMGYILTLPKFITYTCANLFLDAYLTPYIILLVYTVPLNRRCINIACLVQNSFVRGLIVYRTEFLVVAIMGFLDLSIPTPHICVSFFIHLGVFVACFQPLQFNPSLIYPG